jgi:hypothetical protein
MPINGFWESPSNNEFTAITGTTRAVENLDGDETCPAVPGHRPEHGRPNRPEQSILMHSLYRRAAGGKPEFPFRSHQSMDDRSSFETKADAQAWVRMIESEIDRGIFASRVEAEYFLDRLV